MSTKIIVYHGTNQYFDKFEQSKARVINDYFGGGVAYFTVSKEIAHNYAKSMVNNKGGEKYVLEVELNINNLFDVDHMFKGKELSQFFKDNAEAETFARGASLLKFGVDKYSLIPKLMDGSMEVIGKDVFNGLSIGQTKSAAAREKLKKLKYDTLRYNGGVNMQQTIKHDVFIAYKSENINVKNHYLVDSSGNFYKK